MIDPRVYSICKEFGVEIINGSAYPGIGETRAVSTLNRILAKHGEGHFRLMMTTAAETANNKACLEDNYFWCVSDLLIECKALVDHDMTRFLEVFDLAPIDYWQWHIRGKRRQRYLLHGMLFARILVAFQDQRELFDRRAA